MSGHIAVVNCREPGVRLIRAVRDARGVHGVGRDVEATHLRDVPPPPLQLRLIAAVERGIARNWPGTRICPAREVMG